MKDKSLLEIIIFILVLIILGVAAAMFDKGSYATCYDAVTGSEPCN